MFEWFKKKEQRQKILVVDDNQDLVMAVAIVLEGQQYEVKTALNGPGALKVADQFLPDLIILDIMMPGMDGSEVLSNLKLNSRTKDIPVIMLTALNEMKDVEKHFVGGAASYIIKPYSNARLLEAVRAVFAKTGSGGPAITGYIPPSAEQPPQK